MKKSLSILSIVFFIGFTSMVSAQTMPTMPTKIKVPSVSDANITQMQTLFETPDVQTKVKEQLLGNKDLRDTTINFLKNNPKTTKQITSAIAKNPTAKNKVMEYILKNPELTKTAMNFIKNNPEILKKVMGLIGM